MRPVDGTGVRLEPQLAAHADELYAILSDPALYTYTDEKEPQSAAWLRERFGRLEARTSTDRSEDWLNWVVRNGSGVALGYVQATVTPDGNAEIAYVLGRDYWRRGHGFEAVSLMLGELGASYGAKRATATLDPRNAASLALLSKLGFALIEENPAEEEVRYARDLPGEMR